ncbi:MAG: DUF2264 domain-containing protein [Acidimicrobiales bacterium]
MAAAPCWDNITRGLDAGTDPASPDYWGPVSADVDQRMVEQAAIGLAMALLPPARIWDPLSDAAKQRVATWLAGIYEFEPALNNWQFFRVLVSLGLERVGMPFDRAKNDASLALIKTFERGQHWYVDGRLGVKTTAPFALHRPHVCGRQRPGPWRRHRGRRGSANEPAAPADFVHWFDGAGGAIAMGRSLTYQFAMAEAITGCAGLG